MPALDAQLDRLLACHTIPMGISVDSKFSHAAWAADLGGIRFPLLADFHPKGAVARSMGLYLEAAGITDRATVILDAGGTVRYAASVGPGGKRDIEALVAAAEAVDAAWEGDLPDAGRVVPGLPDDAVLYIRDNCAFSRWALAALENLRLTTTIRNVSQDPAALDELVRIGGRGQAPSLVIGGQALYESAEIIGRLAELGARC